VAAEFIVARALDLAKSSGVSSAKTNSDIRNEIIDAIGFNKIPTSITEPKFIEDVKLDGYIVRKLIFEPIKGFPIPAHLYIPDLPGKHPAVVHTPGHWIEDGKLAAEVQRFNVNLVKSGIAVLCFDPIGQGERRIGWHQHGQLAPLLVGITNIGWMARETLSAVDVLESLESIDSEKIGLVGASGGGFISIFASSIDDRIKVAAIGCIVNTHVSQIRDAAYGTGWDGWLDLCNQIPKLCVIGTMGKILSTLDPKKVIIVNALSDPGFPIAGAREVVNEIKSIAEATGTQKNFKYAEVEGGHGLHESTATALIRFIAESFGKNEKNNESGFILDIPFAPQWPNSHEVATAEHPQQFRSLPSKGTCFEFPIDVNESLIDFSKSLLLGIENIRPVLSLERLREVLGPIPKPLSKRVQVVQHRSEDRWHLQTLRIQSELEIEIEAQFALPKNWTDDLCGVFVALHKDGAHSALNSAEAQKALAMGYAVLAPDLRGTGKTACSEFEVATASWMIDRDLLNQRITDGIACIEYLSTRYSTGQQIDKGNIVIWGQEEYGLLGLIITALDHRVNRCGSSGIASFRELMVLNSEISPMFYKHDLLRTLDVQDLLDIISPRNCTIGVPKASVEKFLSSFLTVGEK